VYTPLLTLCAVCVFDSACCKIEIWDGCNFSGFQRNRLTKDDQNHCRTGEVGRGIRQTTLSPPPRSDRLYRLCSCEMVNVSSCAIPYSSSWLSYIDRQTPRSSLIIRHTCDSPTAGLVTIYSTAAVRPPIRHKSNLTSFIVCRRTNRIALKSCYTGVQNYRKSQYGYRARIREGVSSEPRPLAVNRRHPETVYIYHRTAARRARRLHPRFLVTSMIERRRQTALRSISTTSQIDETLLWL